MRPLSLTIAGLPADLPATTTGLLKLSQARASLADVTARVGEYSFAFALPPTRGNAQIFGVHKLHPQGLDKFGFSTDYPCELRVGGQVLRGTFRLSSLKNAYVGNFIGEGHSWALLLGDTKLTDLVFPTITYDGSQLAGILEKDCDGTDVQFPLVAFGNFYHPPLQQQQADGNYQEVPSPPAAVLDYPLSVDDYPPGVYYVNVLRQIFASIGWQLQGRELDSDFWRAVVLTCAGADVAAAWPWGSLLPATGTGAGERSFSNYGQGPEGDYANNAVGFYTLPGDGPELSGDCFFLPVPLRTAVLRPVRSLELRGSTYTALRPGVYDFEWSLNVSGGHHTFGGPNIDQHDPYVQALLRPIGLGLVLRRGGQNFDEGEGGLLRGDPNAGALNYAAGQDRVLTPQRLDKPGGALGEMQLGAYQGAASGVYLETGDSVTLAVFARRDVFDGSNNLLAYRSLAEVLFSATSLSCTRYADNDGVSRTQMQPAAFLPPLSCKEVVAEFLRRTDSFITADTSRRVATIQCRAELAAAGGAPIDLSELCDPRAVEYSPSLGTGVGQLVFAPAAVSQDLQRNDENPLVPPLTDLVTATIGPGTGSQQVSSLFAVVGFRAVQLPGSGGAALLPTCASKDALAQPRSEAERDPSQQTPRLVRYTGPDPSQPVPFGDATVPLASAVWEGPLAWDGEAGAIGRYYAPTLARALRSHLAKVQLPLRPDQYAALQNGRQVALHGGRYTVEAVEGWDATAEGALATVTLAGELT